MAGLPAAIACGGSVDAQVTVQGQAGSSGQATDVMLVLDLSGSMNSPTSKFTNLKSAATATLNALDAADGATDQSIAGNGVRDRLLPRLGGHARCAGRLELQHASQHDQRPPGAHGHDPHAAGINAAARLASSANAKAMVLISDGQASGADLTNATAAATNAKAAGVRIVPIGIGTGSDVSQANLSSWASQSSYYQSGTPGPIDTTKLVADLGAAVAVPTNFTLTETLGANFAAAPVARARARSRAARARSVDGHADRQPERHARLPGDAQRHRPLRDHERAGEHHGAPSREDGNRHPAGVALDRRAPVRRQPDHRDDL